MGAKYFNESNWKEEFIAYSDVHEYIDSPYNYSEILMNDNDVFRVSNDSLTNINGRPENVAMLNRYYGITWWLSIVNGNSQKFINNLVGEELNWRSFGVNNDLILEAFLGVKYYMSESKNVNIDYILRDKIDFNGKPWYIYENPYYFGMAYVRNCSNADFLWINKENNQEYFQKIYKMIDEKQVENEYFNDLKGVFCCTVYAKENEELVISIPFNGMWKAYIDGKEVEVYKTDFMYNAIHLPIGEHTVILRYSQDGFRCGLIIMIFSFSILVFNYLYSKRKVKATV